MSEYEDQGEAGALQPEAEAAANADADASPVEAPAEPAADPVASRALAPTLNDDPEAAAKPPGDARILQLVPAPFERFAQGGGAAQAAPGRGGILGLRYVAAGVAAFAVVAAVGAETLRDRHHQAAMLAERTHETEQLAQTVKTLKARLDVDEAAKPRDDTAELRHAIGELKSGMASAHDLNGALAQLAQRVDKIDHEQNTRIDKIGEKVDKDAIAKAAELAARIEKLEKKSAPVVAMATPLPTLPPPPQATPTQMVPQSPPAIRPVEAIPRALPPLSPETTGSIEKPRPTIRAYAVLDADGDTAMLSSRRGPFEVHVGEVLPGAGRVERIERHGRAWTVVTDQGIILAAE